MPAETGAMTSHKADTDLFSAESHSSPSIMEPKKTSYSSVHGDADTMKEPQFPVHPISSMQGAFEESMLEASTSSTSTQRKPDGSNAASRRKKLLDQNIEEETYASKWRQRPGQQHHELWKLMAQISFGIYLLFNGIAKDDEQVLNILQGHVDEVDAFLETTLEDFDLAIRDIEERLKFLKMPLDNIDIFDAMLEDRQFRLQIVTGNERIEHIIHRTASAMKDALMDVQQGLDATREFAIYLAKEQEGWLKAYTAQTQLGEDKVFAMLNMERVSSEVGRPEWKMSLPDVKKVYDAMSGNTEGWYKAYVALQTKGKHLQEILVQLGSIVAEMDRRAGQVSRNMRFSITPGSAPPLQNIKSTSSSQHTAPSHHSRPSVVSATSSATSSDPNIITQRAPRSTIPEYHAAELESKSEPEILLLQPRIYSPKVSPSFAQRRNQPEAAPLSQVSPIASVRRRFSLKRKAPSETKSFPKPSPPSDHPESVFEVKSSPQLRGPPDSADGSDNDKIYYQSKTSPGYLDLKPNSSHGTTVSDYARSSGSPKPQQTLGGSYVSSPRSDQQQFHPVKASPNAPIQRPWTAAPTAQRSTTSLSKMSQVTTTENGTRVRKKKGSFEWLKKAFSLSEEEKAIFEEKRRAPTPHRAYAAKRKPQILDSKRIR